MGNTIKDMEKLMDLNSTNYLKTLSLNELNENKSNLYNAIHQIDNELIDRAGDVFSADLNNTVAMLNNTAYEELENEKKY